MVFFLSIYLPRWGASKVGRKKGSVKNEIQGGERARETKEEKKKKKNEKIVCAALGVFACHDILGFFFFSHLKLHRCAKRAKRGLHPARQKRSEEKSLDSRPHKKNLEERVKPCKGTQDAPLMQV
jgi:hypothetical protein